MTKTVCYLEFVICFFSPSRKIYPPACKPYGLEAELEAGLSKSGTTHYDSLNCPFILFLDVGHMFAGEDMRGRKTAWL
jgi:hypothetical protein